MSATPRPWHIDPECSPAGWRMLAVAASGVVVSPATFNSLPDAELAKRAINSFDDLVGALGQLCDAIGRGTDDRALDQIADSFGGNVADQYQQARAALAKARTP